MYIQVAVLGSGPSGLLPMEFGIYNLILGRVRASVLGEVTGLLSPK